MLNRKYRTDADGSASIRFIFEIKSVLFIFLSWGNKRYIWASPIWPFILMNKSRERLNRKVRVVCCLSFENKNSLSMVMLWNGVPFAVFRFPFSSKSHLRIYYPNDGMARVWFSFSLLFFSSSGNACRNQIMFYSMQWNTYHLVSVDPAIYNKYIKWMRRKRDRNLIKWNSNRTMNASCLLC